MAGGAPPLLPWLRSSSSLVVVRHALAMQTIRVVVDVVVVVVAVTRVVVVVVRVAALAAKSIDKRLRQPMGVEVRELAEVRAEFR